jgi:voltage-gated potassium channel
MTDVQRKRSTLEPGQASPSGGWRRIAHEIVFEADTKAGKTFDIALIVAILLSVLAVMLESVSSIQARHGELLYAAEWFFTILFTVEYILRLTTIGRPLRYAWSFFGVVDLLAVIPTYIDVLVLPGARYLLVIRALRLLRIFRVLKIAKYMVEMGVLISAMRASVRKITVFLFSVMTIVMVFGTLMYVIEGGENGFTSIPRSIYWAIVTLTTVGYGDIAPHTNIGQTIAAMIMIIGYSIIAVPTGIVTVELAGATRREVESRAVNTQACRECSQEGHDDDAEYCKYCGAML